MQNNPVLPVLRPPETPVNLAVLIVDIKSELCSGRIYVDNESEFWQERHLKALCAVSA